MDSGTFREVEDRVLQRATMRTAGSIRALPAIERPVGLEQLAVDLEIEVAYALWTPPASAGSDVSEVNS